MDPSRKNGDKHCWGEFISYLKYCPQIGCIALWSTLSLYWIQRREINTTLISLFAYYICMTPIFTFSDHPYFLNPLFSLCFLWHRVIFTHLQTYISKAGRGQDPDTQRFLISQLSKLGAVLYHLINTQIWWQRSCSWVPIGICLDLNRNDLPKDVYHGHISWNPKSPELLS